MGRRIIDPRDLLALIEGVGLALLLVIVLAAPRLAAALEVAL